MHGDESKVWWILTIFFLKALFRAHKWSKHKAQTDIDFKCSECPRVFSHKYQLNKHAIMHRPPTFECSYCGQAFKRKNGLLEHFKSFHDDNPNSFQCSECQMKFRIKSNLTRHMTTHQKNRFQCTKCSASFNRKDNYSRHVRTHS